MMTTHRKTKLSIISVVLLVGTFLASCVPSPVSNALTPPASTVLTQPTNISITQLPATITSEASVMYRSPTPTIVIDIPIPSTPGPTKTPAPSDITGYIVFKSQADFTKQEFQLFVANLDTGEIQQLTFTGSNGDPIWSPDGDQIIFTSNRDGSMDLYIMNKDGSDQRRLTDYEGNELAPSWSPDGDRIAFVSTQDGNDEIYVLDIRTQEVTRLIYNTKIDFNPAWSSDGKRIAFTSSWPVYNAPDNNTQLLIVNADGTGVEQLISSPYPLGSPVWCPDDTCIVYVNWIGPRNRIPQLMVIDLSSKESQPLVADFFPDPETASWYPSRSPIRGLISFSSGGMLYALDVENNQLYSLGLRAVVAALYP